MASKRWISGLSAGLSVMLLTVGCAYYREGGRVAWSIGRAQVQMPPCGVSAHAAPDSASAASNKKVPAEILSSTLPSKDKDAKEAKKDDKSQTNATAKTMTSAAKTTCTARTKDGRCITEPITPVSAPYIQTVPVTNLPDIIQPSPGTVTIPITEASDGINDLQMVPTSRGPAN
jgi:hypothetical protein